MTAVDHAESASYLAVERALEMLGERKAAHAHKPMDDLERKLAERHHAVLFRQIATANFETDRFVSLATLAGLSPLVVEYHDDKFAERNPAKHAWLRMRFPCEAGRQGGSTAKVVTLTDVTQVNGLRLRDLTTQWGCNVVDFHHQLVRTIPKLHCLEWHDGSEWFRAHGGNARGYYPALFEIFVSQAVLFESFPTQGCDADFTAEVMIPALKTVCVRRGIRPLICRLDPVETEGDPLWLQYPRDLFDSALRLAGYKHREGRIRWVRRLGLAPHLRSHLAPRKTPSA